MRVVFRADASVAQGSGHVMRCLTLAEELVAQGDDVVFLTAIDSIGWLSAHLAASGFRVEGVLADSLDARAILSLEPDWVVVDSYRIDAAAIGELEDSVQVLAIVDGETRGIDATLYLDQNLGAEHGVETSGRVLAGARFALIRDAILAARRPKPWRLAGPPRLTAFMGGTDPTGTIVSVAQQIALVDFPFSITVVAPDEYHLAVRNALGRVALVVAPTPELPSILANADVIVSAAGTSAWDICTLGVPSLLIGVVDNQSPSLARVVRSGLALGIDLVGGDNLDEIAPAVRRLVAEPELRRSLSEHSTAVFDGEGKRRVVEAMRAHIRG